MAITAETASMATGSPISATAQFASWVARNKFRAQTGRYQAEIWSPTISSMIVDFSESKSRASSYRSVKKMSSATTAFTTCLAPPFASTMDGAAVMSSNLITFTTQCARHMTTDHSIPGGGDASGVWSSRMVRHHTARAIMTMIYTTSSTTRKRTEELQ